MRPSAHSLEADLGSRDAPTQGPSLYLSSGTGVVVGKVRSALLDSCTWAVENILNTFFGSAVSIDGLRVCFSTPTAFSVGFTYYLEYF